MPVDAEEVAWMDIPKPNILQFLLYIGRDLGRILHLCIGGDDDIAFFGSLDGVSPARGIDGEIDGRHAVLLPLVSLRSKLLKHFVSKVVRQLVLYLSIESLTIGLGFRKVFIE